MLTTPASLAAVACSTPKAAVILRNSSSHRLFLVASPEADAVAVAQAGLVLDDVAVVHSVRAEAVLRPAPVRYRALMARVV